MEQAGAKGAAAPFPCTPNPRRTCFRFATECRSASLRNRCSPSPEYPARPSVRAIIDLRSTLQTIRRFWMTVGKSEVMPRSGLLGSLPVCPSSTQNHGIEPTDFRRQPTSRYDPSHSTHDCHLAYSCSTANGLAFSSRSWHPLPEARPDNLGIRRILSWYTMYT